MSNEIRIFGVLDFDNRKSGLYLNQMAKKFDTDTSIIQEANNMGDSTSVRKDKSYLIPVEIDDLEELNAFLEAAEAKIDDSDISYYALETHKPQRGQGLDSFCKTYGITREQFYRLNPDYDSSNPNYIDANTEYNTIRALSDDEIMQEFYASTYTTNNYNYSSDITNATGADYDTQYESNYKDLRYGYEEDNYERAEYLVEAGKYMPEYAQNSVQEKLSVMGPLEKEKNINSVRDKEFNWTLAEYGNIDPNYNSCFDRGDVFVTVKAKNGDTIGSFAQKTGYNEEDIASVNGLSNANKISAGEKYTFEINPDDIYNLSKMGLIGMFDDYMVETVDTRKIPDGEICKISDYINENGIDASRFYFYNKHLENAEYLYGNQIIVVPIEHPAFCADTYLDSNGNKYTIEKPDFVSDEKRKLYEAQMVPLAYGNSGTVPTKLFTSQEEYEQALYRNDYNDEITQLMAEYKDTGIYDNYQEANFNILMYYGVDENQNKAGNNIPYLKYHTTPYGDNYYEFRANSAEFEYDKDTLYDLIGFDFSRYLNTFYSYAEKDLDRFNTDKDQKKIYPDTTINFAAPTLSYIDRYLK